MSKPLWVLVLETIVYCQMNNASKLIAMSSTDGIVMS